MGEPLDQVVDLVSRVHRVAVFDHSSTVSGSVSYSERSSYSSNDRGGGVAGCEGVVAFHLPLSSPCVVGVSSPLSLLRASHFLRMCWEAVVDVGGAGSGSVCAETLLVVGGVGGGGCVGLCVATSLTFGGGGGGGRELVWVDPSEYGGDCREWTSVRRELIFSCRSWI